MMILKLDFKLDNCIIGMILDNQSLPSKWGFPSGSEGKASARNGGDLGSVPGLGRSPGEGNGNPVQYPCLENPMDRETGRLQSMGSQRVGHD